MAGACGLAQDTAASSRINLERFHSSETFKGMSSIKRISEVVEEVLMAHRYTTQCGGSPCPSLGFEEPYPEGGRGGGGGGRLDLSRNKAYRESDWFHWTKRVTPRPLRYSFQL